MKEEARLDWGNSTVKLTQHSKGFHCSIRKPRDKRATVTSSLGVPSGGVNLSHSFEFTEAALIYAI